MTRPRSGFIGLLLLPLLVVAASPEYVAVIGVTAMPEMPTKDLDVDLAALGYESTPQSVPGLKRDLNSDGVLDLLLRGSATYCGTGGCTLYIFDGKSKRQIGFVFGNTLIVHSTAINGWPVLSTYSHSNATSGSYTTSVHNGQQYVQVTSVMLYDESVTELFNEIRSIGTGTSRQ